MSRFADNPQWFQGASDLAKAIANVPVQIQDNKYRAANLALEQQRADTQQRQAEAQMAYQNQQLGLEGRRVGAEETRTAAEAESSRANVKARTAEQGLAQQRIDLEAKAATLQAEMSHAQLVRMKQESYANLQAVPDPMDEEGTMIYNNAKQKQDAQIGEIGARTQSALMDAETARLRALDAKGALEDRHIANNPLMLAHKAGLEAVEKMVQTNPYTGEKSYPKGADKIQRTFENDALLSNPRIFTEPEFAPVLDALHAQGLRHNLEGPDPNAKTKVDLDALRRNLAAVAAGPGASAPSPQPAAQPPQPPPQPMRGGRN